MAKTSFRALLAQAPGDKTDELAGGLWGLLLLFSAAVHGSVDAWEPIQPAMWEMSADGEFLNVEHPLSAVVNLQEFQLRELAEQARRQEFPKEGWRLALTPKGAYAVKWWAACLKDELGLPD
jgi:hypothetical protein